jgi:hypothetical protein
LASADAENTALRRSFRTFSGRNIEPPVDAHEFAAVLLLRSANSAQETL